MVCTRANKGTGGFAMLYDLAVIGSGGGAFAAAIGTRRKGKSVVMIERGTIGGTCVNTGCVPSKALLAAAEARHVSLDGRFPGVSVTPFGVDAGRLIGGKLSLVESLRADKYVDLAAEFGWDILTGTAAFDSGADGPVLEVALGSGGTDVVEAEHYLIATGSTPWAPPIDGLADAGYLTSTTAMELDPLPASMIVLGGSAVGLKQAQLWHRLGVEVTVVELETRLAPGEEPELSRVIKKAFAREGIQVVTAATVTRADRSNDGYRLTLAASNGQPTDLRAEQLLVATGRKPVTDGLNLDGVGVKLGARGEVVVDDELRTHNPRIWAAGDVTGHPQFVYVAGAHGALVADNAFDSVDGRAGRTLDYHHLPRVTFTSPALASAGLTDAQAVAAGFACACRVLPLEHVPRALLNRDTQGVIKLFAERGTGRLLGALVAAKGAGDVIATAVYALANHMTVHQMADLWMPY
ncbi:MAG: mercury(II) reductase, partial [Micromonosporaceae bacterium]